METPIKITCLLCGRNKFQTKSPHCCIGGFRKRKIKWLVSKPYFTEWLKLINKKRNKNILK